ncbi:hypothetical protein BH11PAT4_BH11PAT4_6220 [soil metagenome]
MFALALFAASLTFFIPTPAAAYLDPGTGSYITQVLVASLLGGLYALKLSWSRVKLYFTKSRKQAKGENADRNE